MADHDLAGFERGTFTNGGTTKDVLRCGEGPAVIVMTEMPGISPMVLQFAQRIADIGCTAVLPDLFGTPGRDPNPGTRSLPSTAGCFVGSISRACIRERLLTVRAPA